jgi:hypothetical protein
VIPDDERVEVFQRRRVTGDNEVLSAINAHFLPCAGPQTGVFTVTAFRDEPEEDVQRPPEAIAPRRRRFRQCGQDVLFDQRPPFRQRLGHHITTTEEQQVEYEVVQRQARTMILERIEGRPAFFVERDDLAVEDGPV